MTEVSPLNLCANIAHLLYVAESMYVFKRVEFLR